MRLSPLRQVELILHRRICVESAPSSSLLNEQSDLQQPDMTLRVRSGWKALGRVRRPSSASHQDELQDTRQIIDACRDDIQALWANETVQAGLRGRTIVLEDHYV